MIKNPIFPGFNPDPCICRKGEDYYVIVSSFEWFPGLPVYHSKDLKNWELYTHVLTDDQTVDLRKLPSSKGIWAPCLTYCQEEDLFYVIYGVMNSMNARYFDVDNFLITAREITGPWSEPVYLHSAGFDASILHDRNGKKWVVSLEWETREGYEKPGEICLVEYDPRAKAVAGYPKRIWRGGTDRGCLEAPHLYQRGDWYYLMCAEGGTGYNHCVTMGRAKHVWGPYEGDPANPIVTSNPGLSHERLDPDHLKPQYFYPGSELQKAGHGSFVETPQGEVYLVHLASRPFLPELRCTLGRETGIQRMKWTRDGWLRMEDGSNLAKTEVKESCLSPSVVKQAEPRDDFTDCKLGNCYYSPRIMPKRFADVKARPGYVRIRGGESACSLNKVSLLARKLTSVNAQVTVKMEYTPKVYQHSAGLILYYDNMNYLYLRKYYSETLGQSALSIIRLENGEKTEYQDSRVPVGEEPIYLRLRISGRKTCFTWGLDGRKYERIGPDFDTSRLSDEYCKYGEFTGTMAGMICVDTMKHERWADFDFFEYFVWDKEDEV
ncbi:MAG: glycoside hydrolase family 43 protein [Lachnospiraceae bacterium]|nr:glycoside hydrolase family 43 protein [Lachnospiraceae bacterium]